MTLQMRFKVYLIMYNRLYKPLSAKDRRQKDELQDIFSCIFSVFRVHHGQKDQISLSDHMIGDEQNDTS